MASTSRGRTTSMLLNRSSTSSFLVAVTISIPSGDIRKSRHIPISESTAIKFDTAKECAASMPPNPGASFSIGGFPSFNVIPMA